MIASKGFHELLDYTEELEEILRDHGVNIPDSNKIEYLKSLHQDHSSGERDCSAHSHNTLKGKKVSFLRDNEAATRPEGSDDSDEASYHDV